MSKIIDLSKYLANRSASNVESVINRINISEVQRAILNLTFLNGFLKDLENDLQNLTDKPTNCFYLTDAKKCLINSRTAAVGSFNSLKTLLDNINE